MKPALIFLILSSGVTYTCACKYASKNDFEVKVDPLTRLPIYELNLLLGQCQIYIGHVSAVVPVLCSALTDHLFLTYGLKRVTR